MEQMLTIGEFAQRCGLSRSALRFYDQNGLLKPRMVDAETGYRYYAVAQVQQALLVRQLRSAELPVGALREYLAASLERRREILSEHSSSFQKRANAVEAVIDQLQDELARAGAPIQDRWCWVAGQELAAALGQVSFAIADPAVRADLGAVWIETKDDSLRLVTTDSYRMAVRDLVPIANGPATIRGLIDAARVQGLVEWLQASESVTIKQEDDGVLTVSDNDGSEQVGGFRDGFPDYETILLELPQGDRGTFERDDLQRALQQLDSDAHELTLTFEREQLLLRADECEAAVAGVWSGEPVAVVLALRFFADAVAATVGPDVLIEAPGALQPVTLRSADTGTFSVVTMPIRPSSDS